jgi:redox-sensitive bicupin YhaK (pirin superfamily)
MIQLRLSEERGHAEHGWLNSYHTFSFANYYDPRFSGFRDLLVINEDRVQGDTGFGLHGHKEMEIISYILGGEIEHKDSMGTTTVLKPGDVQRMSAGTGVQHSEFNHSKTQQLHFLQIWILPEKKGIQPDYVEKNYSIDQKRNQLKLIVSQKGEEGSLKINQDIKLYASVLEENNSLSLPLKSTRHAWIQVASGSVELNGLLLNTGDGAAISDESKVQLLAKSTSEVLVFDLK